MFHLSLDLPCYTYFWGWPWGTYFWNCYVVSSSGVFKSGVPNSGYCLIHLLLVLPKWLEVSTSGVSNSVSPYVQAPTWNGALILPEVNLVPDEEHRRRLAKIPDLLCHSGVCPPMDKFESNMSVPGIWGCHKKGLVKSFVISPPTKPDLS